MWELIASIVASILSFLGVVITVLVSNNKRASQTDNKIDSLNKDLTHNIDMLKTKVDDKFNAIDDSICRLEKKQEKYNNLQERTYTLEKTVAIIDERQKEHDSEIDELWRNKQ